MTVSFSKTDQWLLGGRVEGQCVILLLQDEVRNYYGSDEIVAVLVT